MKLPPARALKWLLLPVAAAVAIYWLRFAPVPGVAHTVATADVIGETMGTGTLEARLAASIGPRITGRLTAVNVDQGDRVTAGQLLATLDDAEARRHLEAAEAAVLVCQTQALPLTAEKLADQPTLVSVKRTSLRLRNPANAPDAAERLALDHVAKLVAAGQPPPPVLVQRIQPSGTAKPEWRVYRPIATKAECLVCHGDPATQSPALRAALQTRYPTDAATGYAADQWRGLFRVTIAPAPAPSARP